MKLSTLEEKFIAPSIERKVSLVQNPDFLRAMELSENHNLPDAMMLLEKVIRREPGHVDAYMRMRRIAEVQKDPSLYTRYSAAIFDILLRNREFDSLADLYSQFRTSSIRQPLPAKTLFGIGNYMEESQDYGGAAAQYEELAATYPDDPLTVKALNKLYRLYFDRLSQREHGIQAYWKCRDHRFATDQWRTVLDSDLKRYNVPQLQRPAPVLAPAITPAAEVHTRVEGETVMEHNAYVEPVRASSGNQGCLILPDSAFGARSVAGSWSLVACNFDKIDLKGIILRRAGGVRGILPWKKIQTVSVGKIRKLDPADPRNNQEFLLMDLIAFDFSGPVVYRIDGNALAFDRIFPGVEQTTAEAFQNFVGIILNNSGARCIPSRDSCTGPSFATFPDEERYNARVKEKLLSA